VHGAAEDEHRAECFGRKAVLLGDVPFDELVPSLCDGLGEDPARRVGLVDDGEDAYARECREGSDSPGRRVSGSKVSKEAR
jgi:hypothetical protein